MSAPDRIWAIFEAHKNPKDKVPRVFASASKTKGQEYTRADICDPMQDERVKRLEAENARLRDWLDGIRQYGSDTLEGPSRDTSGSAFAPDDRKWHREGVMEMTARATNALAGYIAEWADEGRIDTALRDMGVE